MQIVISTGCPSLDKQLRGGLLPGNIVLVYGEAGTGKTTLAIQCAVNCARMGYKTIFIDCDDAFSTRRMIHIAQNAFSSLASQIILTKPQDFAQQAYVIERLEDYVGEKVGLIVIDTITGLYRGELGEVKKTFASNRELNRQMAYLAQIAKTRKKACVVVSQVQSVINVGDEKVQPVATRVLEFWADTIIKLKPTVNNKVIKATVEKSVTDEKPRTSVLLRIEKRGLEDLNKT